MMKRRIIPFFFIGLAVLSGFGLIASGMGATAHQEDNCGTPTADTPFMGMSDPEAPYDLRFIDEMVMHHRGAIMSAEMMIGDSEHPELRDLAQRIQEDQQRQIDQMLSWRAEWYPDAAPPTMTMDSKGSMKDGDGMMGGMMGSMMDGDRADRMFLRMMIPHHQLAIDMAEDALINAEHEELKTLAQEIINGQSAEITEMEGYLRAWYDEVLTRDTAATMRSMMTGC